MTQRLFEKVDSVVFETAGKEGNQNAIQIKGRGVQFFKNFLYTKNRNHPKKREREQKHSY